MPGVDIDQLLDATMLIDDQLTARRVVNRLWDVPESRGEAFVAVDLEGVGGRDARAALVQIASHVPVWGDKNVFVFDVQECPSIWNELRSLLETDQIRKVFHGCRQDLFAIQQQQNIRIRYIYDTADADYVIRWQSDRGVDAHPRSLNRLAEVYGCGRIPVNDVGDGFWDFCYRTGRKIWSERPVTQTMLSYAAADADILWQVFESLRFLVRRSSGGADLLDTMIWEKLLRYEDRRTVTESRRQRARDRRHYRANN